MYTFSVLLLAIVLVVAKPRPPAGHERKRQVTRCAPQVFTNTSGFIQTPNYPEDYQNNMDCLYTIQPTGLSTFSVDFYACNCDIESSRDRSCPYDYFELAGGRYCGVFDGLSGTVPSSGGKVDLRFVSDFSVTRPGCNIAYSVSGSGSGNLNATCPPKPTPDFFWGNFTVVP
ncbi:neuropilin-1-like [Liolophura sinensis]|uniref:neuropilin-1-like n=1 Tax=Liolophura sinensis TaxID=3198878 RepID=UPI0031590518